MEDHIHPHEHPHGQASSPEEVLALLTYMVGHNKHHAEELHDLAHSLDDGEAHELIHSAIDDYAAGNEKLEKALALLKGE